MPKRNVKGLTANQQINLINSAMSGDMSFSISPATVNTAETSAAWTRNVDIKVVDSDGKTHEWLTQDYATTLSVGDTSSAGTASIVGTTLSLVEGAATVVVSGNAQDWLNGTEQVETITCTGAPSSDGDITLTVTAAGMTNSPKDVVVALESAVHTTVTLVGDACRTALAADADVASFFAISGTAGACVMTALTAAANDATMAYAFADTDTTGTTFGASADTTAGVAPETDTLTVGNITVNGYTVTGGTSVETFI